ncbi:MAG: BMP family ABC transporter substrate-binding protein [Armatimonadota bacterium]|nr:BMP family ABC transporter substrate-binding protein [Armatimonadota bacterium]
MLRTVARCVLVGVIAIALWPAPSWGAPQSPAGRPISLALLMAAPGRSDLSWSFMHWLGAEQARRTGQVSDLRVVVSTPATALSDMTLVVRDGQFDLIYVASFSTYGTALRDLANRFPDRQYAISDIRPQFGDADPGNRAVLGLLYQQEQPSAMAGALAAALSLHYDCPNVGIVLGREIPVLHEFEMGYKWGGRLGDPAPVRDEPGRSPRQAPGPGGPEGARAVDVHRRVQRSGPRPRGD